MLPGYRGVQGRVAALVPGLDVRLVLQQELHRAGMSPVRGLIQRRGGFDALIGNPPFLGGTQLTEMIGGPTYQVWLKHCHDDAFGNADLSAYFFRRAFSLFRDASTFGLLATKTISEGSSRITGLQHIVNHGGYVYRANRVQKWPGGATVFVHSFT